MSTCWCEVYLPADFQGALTTHRTRHKRQALPTRSPYRRATRFQGATVVKKRRELLPGPPQPSPRSVALPRKPTSRHWNFNQFPFRQSQHSADIEAELPSGLGTADWQSSAVPAKPFSTSAFQVLVGIIATSTKICTRQCSTRAHALGFVTMPTSAYSSRHGFYRDGGVWVAR